MIVYVGIQDFITYGSRSVFEIYFSYGIVIGWVLSWVMFLVNG